MDTIKGSATAPQRRFSNKRQQVKNGFFDKLQSYANVIISMGLLLTGTGLICFIPFHNKISKLILVFGLCIFMFGFAIKIIDICVKIIGGRR